MGPTASGKTEVALALATRFPLEIVSVDSAQVFIGMDIGTAKPDRATREKFPHHLIDLVTPEEAYSAARFRDDALRAMGEITARGRIPLLVGGTLLYFKALTEGLSDLPPADAGLRREIDAEAARRGWPALHAELARLDPAAAARLEPGDAQRIQRALEVVRLTGAPLAASLARRSSAGLPYRPIQLALLPSLRSALHERIARRFDAMLAAGLLEELRELRREYRLHAALPAMRCVGYRQAWSFLEDAIGPRELREKGIAASRQLAKRQLTWLRSWPGLERFDCLAADAAGQVAAKVEQSLAQVSAGERR
ncbi:MAG TPA: tRNA (adenosine(37)-N6)-dimethylallyltransferase MiaA [Candidatus Desulfobacillus sp.]|nr:tRNA (adenosine(37)-N6)-dimethylallyltransferase MiaA [Candidatus Desulfobacillus sp.]